MTADLTTGRALDSIDTRRLPTSLIALIALLLAILGAVTAMLVAGFDVDTRRGLIGVPNPGPITNYGMPMVQSIGELGAAIAVGGTLFAAFFVPPQTDGRLDVGGWRALRIAAWGATVWGVAALLMIPLVMSDVTGRPLSACLSPDMLRRSLSDAGGDTWLWTAVLAALTVAATAGFLRWWWSVVGLGVAAASLLPVALAGHSSAGGAHDVATNSLILHIGGAVVWLGGLAAVLIYVAAQGRYATLAVARYSRVAFWALIVVAASGVINALVRVSFGSIFSSEYGALLIAKFVALVIVGGLGAWHRRVTIPALGSGDRRPFIRFAAVEILVFAITFGIAVGLAWTAPPQSSAELSVTEVALGYTLPGPITVGHIFTLFRWDVIFSTAAVVLAAVYLRGVWRLRRRGDAWPVGRTISWLLGNLVLLFATASGLGMYAPALFSMHMVEHMMFSMLVPVLLVMGAPITLALRALPAAGAGTAPGPREWILAALHSPLSRFLTQPLVAALIFVGSFYALYFGGIFSALMPHHFGHVVMMGHFLISGYLFYWVVIGIDPAPRQVSPVVKLGMVFGSLPFHAFFGVALMSTDTVIADSYYRSLLLPWHPDLLNDQRLGGGIAWAAGEVPLVVVMAALLVQWSRSDARVAKRYDRQADRDKDADLGDYNAMLARLAGRDSTAQDSTAQDSKPDTSPPG